MEQKLYSKKSVWSSKQVIFLIPYRFSIFPVPGHGLMNEILIGYHIQGDR